MTDDVEWMTPSEAEQWIALHLGHKSSELYKSRNQMERWIEQGHIRIKAIEVVRLETGCSAPAITAKNAGQTKASAALPLQKKVERNACISPQEWVHAILASNDMTLWTDSEITAPIRGSDYAQGHIIYSGVRLAKNDIAFRLELSGRQPIVLIEPEDIKRTGRPRGSGTYRDADAPLHLEMKKLVQSNKAKSPNDAARMVADRAAGTATLESKISRLVRTFPFRKIDKK